MRHRPVRARARRRRRALAAAAALAVGAAWGCAGRRGSAPAVDAELARLASWMTGSFSSAAQAAADERFRDVRLRVAGIWTDRTDGRWLYVEQAVAEALDRPYRQRVYQLRRIDGGRLESRVFEIRDAQRWIGAWREPERLAAVGREDLTLRDGCSVVLRAGSGGRFVGGTLGRGCRSTLRGAAYATSEVEVGRDGLVSWDRGFDGSGSQVWGATSGGYRFDRQPAGGD